MEDLKQEEREDIEREEMEDLEQEEMEHRKREIFSREILKNGSSFSDFFITFHLFSSLFILLSSISSPKGSRRTHPVYVLIVPIALIALTTPSASAVERTV